MQIRAVPPRAATASLAQPSKSFPTGTSLLNQHRQMAQELQKTKRALARAQAENVALSETLKRSEKANGELQAGLDRACSDLTTERLAAFARLHEMEQKLEESRGQVAAATAAAAKAESNALELALSLRQTCAERALEFENRIVEAGRLVCEASGVAATGVASGAEAGGSGAATPVRVTAAQSAAQTSPVASPVRGAWSEGYVSDESPPEGAVPPPLPAGAQASRGTHPADEAPRPAPPPERARSGPPAPRRTAKRPPYLVDLGAPAREEAVAQLVLPREAANAPTDAPSRAEPSRRAEPRQASGARAAAAAAAAAGQPAAGLHPARHHPADHAPPPRDASRALLLSVETPRSPRSERRWKLLGLGRRGAQMQADLA